MFKLFSYVFSICRSWWVIGDRIICEMNCSWIQIKHKICDLFCDFFGLWENWTNRSQGFEKLIICEMHTALECKLCTKFKNFLRCIALGIKLSTNCEKFLLRGMLLGAFGLWGNWRKILESWKVDYVWDALLLESN